MSHSPLLYLNALPFLAPPCPPRPRPCPTPTPAPASVFAFDSFTFNKDIDAWRPGRIISIRSNGTFVAEYDEDGCPKEDCITESRLRHRHGRRHNSSDPRPRNQREGSYKSCKRQSFEEGDIVLVPMKESVDCPLATIEKCLGDSFYLVNFLNGSGTKKLEHDQLR